MKEPSVEACKAIVAVMGNGSSKDGCNETWRQKEIMYHLSKAQSHLSTHIKQIYDSRTTDNENHIHLALTRLAMAMCIEI